MATDEGKTADLAEWGDRIAVGGLVAAGLLVSFCGPILRRRNETLRAELDDAVGQLGAVLDRAGELGPEDQAAAPDVGAEDQAAAPDVGAEDQAAAPEGPPLPHLARELNGQAADLGADAP
jgi:hypothetical protein